MKYELGLAVLRRAREQEVDRLGAASRERVRYRSEMVRALPARRDRGDEVEEVQRLRAELFLRLLASLRQANPG